MSELSLQIKSDDEITLPNWIAASTLSLAEIGALTCLACIPSMAGGHHALCKERVLSPDMEAAIASLEEKGIFKGTINGSQVTMEVDLDAIAPS